MKLAALCFGCDALEGDCGEESPHESTWPKARSAALSAGWALGKAERALCPAHFVRASVEKSVDSAS